MTDLRQDAVEWLRGHPEIAAGRIAESEDHDEDEDPRHRQTRHHRKM